MPGTTSKQHQHQAKANQSRRTVYKTNGTREINKAKKILRHLKRQPWDGRAFDKLKAIPAVYLTRGKIKIPILEKSPVILRREVGITLTQQQGKKTHHLPVQALAA